MAILLKVLVALVVKMFILTSAKVVLAIFLTVSLVALVAAKPRTVKNEAKT